MKSKFLALAIATAALNVFALAVGHAQGYIVNGHNASKAEAQFLTSYSAPPGSGSPMDMASRGLPMSTRRRSQRPAPSAGMSSTCSFATDLTPPRQRIGRLLCNTRSANHVGPPPR